MKAEIIAVGTELLLGDILNTNAQYLSKELAALGISVYYQSVVGDNETRLFNALQEAFEKSDMVIATGGLGPTKDDLTKEVGAKYFNKELVLDEESLNSIESFFKRMCKDMPESNKKQAMLPKGCIILKNNNGTAPGCIIEEGGKTLILLPGPPKEAVPMFEESVKPYLKKFSEGILISKVLRTFGLGESSMAEKVGDIINRENPTVAPYAKDNEAILRITAKGKDEEEAKKLISQTEKEIRNILGDYIYGEGDITLEYVVAEMLVHKNITVATAESCTGGLIAATLVNYPGVSSIFTHGVVTYANEAKVQLLGVKNETLEKYGAVSEQTAKEMAEGIVRISGARIGISVTGIAGPGGGTKEKPVGLVYAGMCIDGEVKAKKLNLTGDRQKVRTRTVMTVLDWLRRELKEISE
ncbi:competence/damage-inducible protein A [Clostridium sp. 19966]|uniref:competence/damage-inducible protein A n=1 Tax=Clostridium sp. 19966 TaxID=2768166 RepID=UPI0028DED503|nr:competence/damage-inducible protein A [Clostridium sp. 19966]MDT8719426.1 competence/damage-inducible protein A [Clostridium sp. 19966]